MVLIKVSYVILNLRLEEMFTFSITVFHYSMKNCILLMFKLKTTKKCVVIVSW